MHFKCIDVFVKFDLINSQGKIFGTTGKSLQLALAFCSVKPFLTKGDV